MGQQAHADDCVARMDKELQHLQDKLDGASISLAHQSPGQFTALQEEINQLRHQLREASGEDAPRSCNGKALALAAEAVLSSTVKARFGVTSDDLKNAVLEHSAALGMDAEFKQLHAKILHNMSLLLSAGGDKDSGF